MKNFLTALFAMSVMGAIAITPLPFDPNAETRAKAIVDQMTLDEKVSYLSGETSFSLRPIDRVGIPRILIADGPQGIRNHTENSTLYPCGVALAATWNRQLADRYGKSLGDDARARGVRMLLGPGVNIYRSPLCGRSYEYMGEDPYLTSEMAKHYIMGIQSRGVIATIKHFAANNQEWNRHHVSSEVDERTLNEIYFPAFRTAVKEARVGAVMDSYNLLNGVHATENSWLNTEVLRNQWKFNGILVSDWTSTYSTVALANSGLDLEMPEGRYFNAEKLLPAIKNGLIDPITIDLKVQHLLQTFIAHGFFDEDAKIDSIPLDYEPSRATALEVACEAMVLLKNQDNILPLKGRTLILGPNAAKTPTGGGSGFVTPFSTVSPAEGLKKLRSNTLVLTDDILYNDITAQIFTDSTLTQKGFVAEYFNNQTFTGCPAHVKIDDKIKFNWGNDSPGYGLPDDHFSVRWKGFYRPDRSGQIRVNIAGDDGYRLKVNGQVVSSDWGNHSYSQRQHEMQVEKGVTYNLEVDFFDNIATATIECEMLMLNESLLDKMLRQADNVVLCTGFNSNTEGEGFDRPFAMTDYQEKFINHVASINPNLVVVLNAGGGVDMTTWEPVTKAIVMAWYSGQEWGTALAEILTGKACPSGKLPISIEYAWEDNPCYGSYYENNMDSELKRVEYNEGIFVGYRGYDRNGVIPRYPFGFGLSYTDFVYSNLSVEKGDDENVMVRFDITNKGKCDGSEVAQVYVGDVEASVPRPVKELKGFEKVLLRKGETKRITINLGSDAFAFYSMKEHDWVVQPGIFNIFVGGSSNNLPLSQTINL